MLFFPGTKELLSMANLLSLCVLCIKNRLIYCIGLIDGHQTPPVYKSPSSRISTATLTYTSRLSSTTTYIHPLIQHLDPNKRRQNGIHQRHHHPRYRPDSCTGRSRLHPLHGSSARPLQHSSPRHGPGVRFIPPPSLFLI